MYSEYEHLVEMPEGIANNIDFLTEMNDKIESEVKKRLAAHIDDYNLSLKQFKNSKEELSVLKNQLNSNARLLEKKIVEIKKEAFSEGRKSLLGGFDIGSKGWVSYPFSNKSVCPRCTGKKDINVKYEGAEIKVRCDVCQGYGHKITHGFRPIACTLEGIKHEEYNQQSGQTVYYVRLEDEEIIGSHQGQRFFSTKTACNKYIESLGKK